MVSLILLVASTNDLMSKSLLCVLIDGQRISDPVVVGRLVLGVPLVGF